MCTYIVSVIDAYIVSFIDGDVLCRELCQEVTRYISEVVH